MYDIGDLLPVLDRGHSGGQIVAHSLSPFMSLATFSGVKPIVSAGAGVSGSQAWRGPTVLPPSTTRWMPVPNFDSSPARNKQATAMSRGRPLPFKGCTFVALGNGKE